MYFPTEQLNVRIKTETYALYNNCWGKQIDVNPLGHDNEQEGDLYFATKSGQERSKAEMCC